MQFNSEHLFIMKYFRSFLIVCHIFWAVVCVSISCPAQDKSTLSQKRYYVKNNIAINPSLRFNSRFADSDFFGVAVSFGPSNWLETGIALDFNRRNYAHDTAAYVSMKLIPRVFCRVHPLGFFLDTFSVVDVYGIVGIGGFFWLDDLIPQPLRNRWYMECGGGIALNISRHFGVFYEYSYDSILKSSNRFGFNIRFGGPKKWQNTKQ